MKKSKLPGLAIVATTIATALIASAATASVGKTKPFISRFHTITHLASMVPKQGPAKGDQNPYGVAVVQRSVGKLVKGDVLVSNFNNGQNQQGTGSSIMEVSPSGHARVFAVVPRPTKTKAVGLTTALVELPNGLRCRGQPARAGELGEDDGRGPDDPQLQGYGGQDAERRPHQRPLGHDRRRPTATRPRCS